MIKIGLIGYGMVGKALFASLHLHPANVIIVDPLYTNYIIKDLLDTEIVFIAVPTDEGDKFRTLLYTIEELKSVGYKGIIVVKSTVLPGYLPKGVVYNPEFLSRATANRDFVRPALLVLGGDTNQIVAKFYHNHTYVVPDKVVVTDVNTAIMIKYLLNTFGATKVTFMNMMHEVAQECGADWNTISNAIADHPYIGRNHTQVPGPDGNFGFGGPCLPKDTKALAEEYDLPLLRTVLELNNHYRSQ